MICRHQSRAAILLGDRVLLNIRMGRTGSADRSTAAAFAWLATRMATLGRVLVEALMLHYGRDEVAAGRRTCSGSSRWAA